jgi:transposase-like protein
MKVKAMNRPMDAKSIPRRKYDKAFKQQAVELWMSSGKSAALVAAGQSHANNSRRRTSPCAASWTMCGNNGTF